MLYQDFINNILSSRDRFMQDNTEYHERHHILPRCCGGIDDKSNLIDLYPQEHFIAHQLLAQENPDNIHLVRAYNIMAFASNEQQQRYQLTPDEYAQARKQFSQALKAHYANKENHPCYGTHISEERKKKISEINKGNKYCQGRVLSDETKKKIGEANRNPSEETRKKMSDSRKGKHLGGENPSANKVVRLSDGKVYDSMKEAALENNVNYSTFRSWVHKGKNFAYVR